MPNALVFVTYNITPEHWNDFSQTADIPPQPESSGPRADPNPPYVLVHSHSQTDFDSTGDLSKSAETDFEDATHADMYAFMTNILTTVPEEQRRNLMKSYFLVLDQESEEDRKAIYIHKGLENVNEETGEVVDSVDGGPLRKRDVWKRHRVPFEDAFNFRMMLEMLPGDEGEDFLQKTTRETPEGL